ncbi:50S ribosomal protein L17 [Microgenomates group bacterium RBG_16_45_19]|nr:MAG: 50S ribosomal protein L17 [Microgenomates group bacterium RBG_16_45_19]
MRHRLQGHKLNRNSAQRRALFKNLARSLIEHQRLTTTLAKAKAVQGKFDRLMVQAKSGTLKDRRLIEAVINDRRLVNRLVMDLAPLSRQRASGFTRIIRLNRNRGDAALKVRWELVDLPQAEPEPTKAKAKTRSKLKIKPMPPPTTKESLKPKAPSPVPTSAGPVTLRKTP